ncbi:hypothetical protein ACE1CD_17575 [Aerosakkonema sp. BLCC-F183]|uniref:hypothetical protein n=1 Tax=Aerosakkonema sp. BLCC-F183 TaxID=3342834 RepID=UPI0035B85A07
MTTAQEIHTLKSVILLPFRAMLHPGEVSLRIFDDKWETKFSLSYLERFPITNTLQINTELCTLVIMETIHLFPGNKEEAKNWFEKNSAEVFSNYLLPRLNHFLLRIKYVNPNIFDTGVIRNVGDIDIVFWNLIYQEETIRSRAISTFFGSVSKPKDNSINYSDLNIAETIPKEWSILTRSVDLVNHGYFLEGFVVAFALLDEMVQQFVKSKLPLDPKEAEDLLRKIEKERLKTYLGPMIRLAGIESPLDNDSLKKDLAWINEKRNKIMHRGEECSREDAQGGLKIVLNILKYLKDKGNTDYCLPEKLGFWTEF